MSSNDARLAILETTILHINTTLQDIRQDIRRIDSKIDNVDKKFESKFDSLDKKFESKLDSLGKKFDTRFDILQNRIWSNFLWLMTMIIGLAGLIAHTQHWF